MSNSNRKLFRGWFVVLWIIGGIHLLSSFSMFPDSVVAGIFSIILGLILVFIPFLVMIVRSSRTTTSLPKSSSYNSVSSPNPITKSNDPAEAIIPRYDYFKYNHLTELPKTYVCIDLETTGLYPEHDRITEVAAARVENGVVVDTFSSLVRSSVPVDAFVSKLTGITNAMLASAPYEYDVIPRLFSFMGNFPIIGYNVSFDMGFLHYAAYRSHKSLVRECFDVQWYARKCLPGRPGYKLSNVAEYLSVDQPEAHRALADVLTTTACAEKMRPIMDDINDNERKKAARQALIDSYDFSRINVDYKSIVPTVSQIDTSSPFYGKRIVFTGALERMTRKDACQIVANLGGQPWGSVTKGTAYLVVGDGPASPYDDPGMPPRKVTKAEEWKVKGSAVKILSEKEFFDIIDHYHALSSL